MKKLIILSSIFVLFLLVVIPVLLTFSIRTIPGGVQPSLGNTQKIYGDFTLSQAFVSPEDNLTGIGVSIKNPNFANKKNTQVEILDENNNILRKVTLNGQNIADGNFVKIIFDPITSARDKKFIWFTSSKESTFDDALEIFLTKDKPTWSLDLQVNGKIQQDTLSYVTLHKSGSPTAVLKTVFRGWLDKFTGDKLFLISYLVLILFLTGCFIFSKSVSVD